MDTGAFRGGVRDRLRLIGRTQQDLAREIGLHPKVLSHKLHGAGRYTLTRDEVRGIVRILAGWGAFYGRAEAEELLALGGLVPGAFTEAEWRAPPLGQLGRDRSRAQAVAPPHSPLAPQVRALPVPRTRLVGRGREAGEVAELLTGDARLVTLTGVGGTGKTRLAVEVASRLRGAFPDGAAFVDLSAVRDPALVPAAIALALGLREVPGVPQPERLAEYLRDRRILLVLDNLEQVLPAAALVGDLLSSAPGLVVLATSRAPLRLYGEHEYRVPPLGLPSAVGSREEILGSEAVRLFAQRARAAGSGFGTEADDLLAVAGICERLDGLPLAIELAAARTRIYTPRALLERLGSRLVTLTGGARDLPERQRTLRATLDWSYELLAEPERRLFARLSVFLGGRTLAGIEAVCDPAGELDVPGGVEALLEHSLLRREEGRRGEPRFVMLETIHEYAAEKLERSGEAEELRSRHAEYFLELVERAEPELAGRNQLEWLDRLEEELDNLRTAFSWALGREPEVALRLASALGRFWRVHGRVSEGLSWLERALERGEAAPASVRAKALASAAYTSWVRGDPGRARGLATESLELYRGLGDERGVANALTALAIAVSNEGDIERARRLEEESLRLYRRLGDDRGIGWTLNNLAVDAKARGDYGKAKALLDQGLGFLRRVGDRSLLGVSLWNLATIAMLEGKYGQARTLYREALELWLEIGYQEGIAYCLEGIAAVAGGEGETERAARLYGAAQALRELAGIPVQGSDRPVYERFLSAARSGADEGAWEEAWEEGRRVSLQKAVMYALEGVDAGDAPVTSLPTQEW